jgi:hypothetical protein
MLFSIDDGKHNRHTVYPAEYTGLAFGKDNLYGVHPVVSRDIINGDIYTTIISMNINKNKSILTYQHSFIVQSCSATCFNLQEVIIRRIYKK